ncbi:MAG: hypothetical protein QOG58_3080 [Caballeronia sp.]|jgi:hypothetical protein|nr:hypothetical protein [Caballeronia sp.]
MHGVTNHVGRIMLKSAATYNVASSFIHHLINSLLCAALLSEILQFMVVASLH